MDSRSPHLRGDKLLGNDTCPSDGQLVIQTSVITGKRADFWVGAFVTRGPIQLRLLRLRANPSPASPAPRSASVVGSGTAATVRSKVISDLAVAPVSKSDISEVCLMKILPPTASPPPNSRSPLPGLPPKKAIKLLVGVERLMSVSNHRSALTPATGCRGLRSATVQVCVPKVRLVAVMPDAEYPCHSCVVVKPPEVRQWQRRKCWYRALCRR
jgi:hypothetical protein